MKLGKDLRLIAFYVKYSRNICYGKQIGAHHALNSNVYTIPTHTQLLCTV